MSEIKVYDSLGNPQSLEWLKDNYGDFIIKEAVAGDGPVHKITALYERKDNVSAAPIDHGVHAPSALVVRVLDKDGNPIGDVRVAWYWPDADPDDLAGPKGGTLPQMNPDRAVSGTTNVNGDIGFGMGSGAYYWPDKGEIGPHAVWIYGTETRSDLILGLGMVAATNHDHFDVEYTRFEESPSPPTPPPDYNYIIDQLKKIKTYLVVETSRVEEAVDGLEAVITNVEDLLADLGW